MTEATAAPPEPAADEPTTDQPPPDAPADEHTGASAITDPAVVLLPLPARPGPANVSPDNSTLAFLQPDSEGKLRLWLQGIEADDEAPRALDLPFEPLVEFDPAGDPSGDEGPQWSPDGTLLALTGTNPVHGMPAIWLVEVATGAPRLLTNHPAADRGPRWSPDGQAIAFTSFRDGRDTICTVAAAGGPASQWTDGVQDDRDPAWSRDGAQLVFRRAVAGHPTHHDLWILTLATGELKQITNVPGRANAKAANRRSPRWAPNRSLIAFITDEKEWDAIAVVNPENLSGWTLADDPGDKAEFRWSPNGLRILYTRTLGAITRCCAKGTSAAKPDLLDPADGVARSPRWLGDYRVVYLHGSPTTPWRFIVQDAKVETERKELTTGVTWSGPREGLAAPGEIELEVGDGAKVGALLYRPAIQPAPALVSLGDGPPVRQAALPGVLGQALAAAGWAVVTPNLRGTPGAGRAFTNRLTELADQEIESADLADLAVALRGVAGITGDQIAIAGRGYGATLALLAVSSRPGHYAAVVAVDPIVDWEREIDVADPAFHTWALRTFGLPSLHGGRYALRAPATFVPLLDVPVLLIGTGGATPARAAQLDDFAAILDEFGIGYERAASDGSEVELARLTIEFLSRRLGGAAPRPAEPAPAETSGDAPPPEPVEHEAAEPAP